MTDTNDRTPQLDRMLAEAGLEATARSRVHDTMVLELAGAPCRSRDAVAFHSPRRGTTVGIRVDLPAHLAMTARDVHSDAALRLLGAVSLAAQGRGLTVQPMRGREGLEGFVLQSTLCGTATGAQLREELESLAMAAEELSDALDGPPASLSTRLVTHLGPRLSTRVELDQPGEPVIVPTFDPARRAEMLERSKRLGGG